jgi:hypothetical protein
MSMGKGYQDARIGALYYGKGGYGEQEAYTDHFWRGGGRRDGGRGFNFDCSSVGAGHGSGGKKGDGKHNSTYKAKFDGH